MLEMKSILARLIMKYKLLPVEDGSESNEMEVTDKIFSQEPKNPVKIRLEPIVNS